MQTNQRANQHAAMLESLRQRFGTKNVVTVSVHDDEAFEDVRALAAECGFAVAPGTFLTSMPHHVPEHGLLVTHVAHFQRVTALEPRGAPQVATTRDPPEPARSTSAEGRAVAHANPMYA